jgi:hypothetical protein
MALVYLATSPSGKVYVGWTSKSLPARIVAHYCGGKQKSKQAFFKALTFYDKCDIDWEILVDNVSESTAKFLEKKYISMYDSYKNGYNCTEGGEGVLGLKMSQEAKQHMRNASARPEVKLSRSLARKEYLQRAKEQGIRTDYSYALTDAFVLKCFLINKKLSMAQYNNILILFSLGAHQKDVEEWFNSTPSSIYRLRTNKTFYYRVSYEMEAAIEAGL